jgi:hypothetical protein
MPVEACPELNAGPASSRVALKRTPNPVLPAKAGIQKFLIFPDSRSPSAFAGIAGMTFQY